MKNNENHEILIKQFEKHLFGKVVINQFIHSYEIDEELWRYKYKFPDLQLGKKVHVCALDGFECWYHFYISEYESRITDSRFFPTVYVNVPNNEKLVNLVMKTFKKFKHVMFNTIKEDYNNISIKTKYFIDELHELTGSNFRWKKYYIDKNSRNKTKIMTLCVGKYNQYFTSKTTIKFEFKDGIKHYMPYEISYSRPIPISYPILDIKKHDEIDENVEMSVDKQQFIYPSAPPLPNDDIIITKKEYESLRKEISSMKQLIAHEMKTFEDYSQEKEAELRRYREMNDNLNELIKHLKSNESTKVEKIENISIESEDKYSEISKISEISVIKDKKIMECESKKEDMNEEKKGVCEEYDSEEDEEYDSEEEISALEEESDCDIEYEKDLRICEYSS